MTATGSAPVPTLERFDSHFMVQVAHPSKYHYFYKIKNAIHLI